MRIGSRRPTRYVFVPGPVIMPGLSPSTRPTSSDTVAVFGNVGSIQLTPVSPPAGRVGVVAGLAGPELGRGAAPGDLALLEDVVRVGDPRQRGQVLVDQQDRLSARHEVLEAAPDLRPDERGEPLRRLVTDEQARVRHEGAADREHLLLAAGERAPEDALPGRELGEQGEDLLDRPRVRVAAAVRRGRHEVLTHREVREDLTALRHETDPGLRHAVRGEAVDRAALEVDPPRPPARGPPPRTGGRRPGPSAPPPPR